MYYLFGLGLLICCHLVAIAMDGYSILTKKRNKFEDFLENSKSILKMGKESLGIPIFDPFAAKKMLIKIDQDVVNLDVLFTDVDVRDLSQYNVNGVNCNIYELKFNMNLSWPLISAKTNYDMKGKAFTYFDVYGNGEMKMSAHDLTCEAEIHFELNDRYFKVKKVKTSVFLKELNFQITGLFDHDKMSELLSVVTSDMMPQLIRNYQDIIIKNLNFVITEKLNAFLSDKDLYFLLTYFSELIF